MLAPLIHQARYLLPISLVGGIWHTIFFADTLPIVRIVATVAGLILLVNTRSLPLVWHLDILLPFGIVRCNYYILSLRHMLFLRSSSTRHSAVVTQLESCCPVGANPFEFTITSRSWVSPDETDWFGHVNNSTYAKFRDIALSNIGIAAWPTFVNAGGSIALGSTHYQFFREIPRFATYETKISIEAWDHKWMYFVCRITSHSGKVCGNSSSTKPGDLGLLSQTEPESSFATVDDIRSTVSPPHLEEKSDGTNLHCLCVFRVCFKMGRMTVPPAIIMACEGFSKAPPIGSYSHQSPPPHWVYPHTLRNASNGLGVYRRFLAGGWKDVAEEDRWWVEALGGPIEERRRANLAKLEIMNEGEIGCMNI